MRWRMPKYLLVGLPFCLLALLAPLMGSARQPVATFPVIVVFDHNAPLAHWRGLFRADDRVQANPGGWSYLDLNVAGLVQALEARHAFRADHVYSAALRGFAARLTASQIEALENDPTVEYVEADGIVSIVAQTLPWGINRIDADIGSTKAGDGAGGVSNVNVYIIDTGIDTAHRDLNVVKHVDFSGLFGGGNKDCNGHGTHVAGTVAARDNTVDVVGMAPGAPLTGVKVLGCNGSGTTSGVIKGIDWVTANAKKPAIANMSLSGGASSALDDAVRRSVNKGVFYSIAAGNSGANACNYSPARAGAGTDNGIMTAAATDTNDTDPSWSNFGSCVDIWAPGVNILSTRRGGGTTTMSGTSMAAPHVGGTAALYLSQNPLATPAQVESALKANALSTGTTSNGVQPIKLVYAGSF